VTPGELLWVRVDHLMVHDGGLRQIAPRLAELQLDVWDPSKVIVVNDHYVPASTEKAAEALAIARQWSAENGIQRFYDGQGISHTIVVEEGLVRPGELYVGGDSHTCTAGVLGCLAIGVGSTDILCALATGELWVRVPPTIRFDLLGKRLSLGVSTKDLVLSAIKDHGMDGALYKVVEFLGEGVAGLSMEERSVLTNMCAELGAKSGIFPPDSMTRAHFASLGIEIETELQSDTDATYDQVWEYDLGSIQPVVAAPSAVDNVIRADEAAEVRITQAYIGACTGAKYEDLEMAAAVLRGHSVAPGVRLLIAPASRSALARAIESGVASDLMSAGAHILSTGCGACPGIGSGVLGPTDVCISTTNRNFTGRMGSAEAQIYLGSPYTVAASALAGRIIDPRTVMADAE